MKSLIPKLVFFFLLPGLLFSPMGLFGQSNDRYFDQAKGNSDDVILTVFYPIEGLINILAELRKQGFLSIPNLVVVGVYDESESLESTDYQKSQDAVAKNSLNWMKFHRLSGELSPENVFQKNPCTPEFEKIFRGSDGIIFFGGADIPPSIYGEKTSLLTSIQTPHRHLLELSAIYHLLGGSQKSTLKPLLESSPSFPVLSFCLGCQSLNVGTGGTLVQDIWADTYKMNSFEEAATIPEKVLHRNPYTLLFPEKKFMLFVMHPIQLAAEGKFCSELGFSQKDRPYVLSAHHQAVGKLGEGMRIAATSLDGKVIEAIQHEKYPNVLGCQFHPEYPFLYDANQKYKLRPEDKEAISFRSILENNPPSFAFHKKLWAWFCSKTMEFHKQRTEMK